MVEIVATWEPSAENDGENHRDWAQTLSEDLAPHALPGGLSKHAGTGRLRADGACLRFQHRPTARAKAALRSGKGCSPRPYLCHCKDLPYELCFSLISRSFNWPAYWRAQESLRLPNDLKSGNLYQESYDERFIGRKWAARGEPAVFNTRFFAVFVCCTSLHIHILGGPERAHDAIEGCRLRASRNPPRFEYEGEFRRWLVRVLVDEALTGILWNETKTGVTNIPHSATQNRTENSRTIVCNKRVA